MILTIKQEEAIKIAVERFKAKEKYVVISGYAGTGKTTLVQYIISALGVDPNGVAYATFTGKAASVLRNKGNENAMTLHKLLYEHTPMPDGSFIKTPKKELEYNIVVIDEISMVPKEMVELLFSFDGVFAICLGDPFQIPPINPDGDNHLLDSPHVFLDEVLRQAQESGIVRLSMKIRNGERFDNFSANDVMIVPSYKFVDGMITWADIVLCSTNRTRKNINEHTREMLGYHQPIVNGEKIICARNYWNKTSTEENALVNGCVGYLDNFSYADEYFPKYFGIQNNKIPILRGTFTAEYGDSFGMLNIDKTYFLTEENYLTPQQSYLVSKNIKFKNKLPLEFTYAYAITGHRAQGSQWGKVLVLEENFPFSKEDHARWLYTCCTRPTDQLVLVTKE